jgi:hypothetical protein
MWQQLPVVFSSWQGRAFRAADRQQRNHSAQAGGPDSRGCLELGPGKAPGLTQGEQIRSNSRPIERREKIGIQAGSYDSGRTISAGTLP